MNMRRSSYGGGIIRKLIQWIYFTWCEIWASHGEEVSSRCFLGCDAV